MLTFQQIILKLQDYWAGHGCALLQPYDMEVGAGTSHTATFLRSLGPEPWKAAYVQPSRRPKDGRYGDNPNRLQHYYQYQVVLKPAPADILALYLGSLEALGLDLTRNDVRFVEDDWENPTLGCWGLGLGGLAQRHGSHAVHLLPAGRRHRLQAGNGRDHLRAGASGDVPSGCRERSRPACGRTALVELRRRVPCRTSRRVSRYNFEHSDVEFLSSRSTTPSGSARQLISDGLDSAGLRTGAGGVARLQPAGCATRHFGDRAPALHIAGQGNGPRGGAKPIYDSREALGFPMCDRLGRRDLNHPARKASMSERHPQISWSKSAHRGVAAESTAAARAGIRRRTD